MILPASLPVQCSGTKLQLCDATTGHVVQNVAFCDSAERAEAIDRALRQREIFIDTLRTIANQSLGDDWTAEQAFAFVKQAARDILYINEL